MPNYHGEKLTVCQVISENKKRETKTCLVKNAHGEPFIYKTINVNKEDAPQVEREIKSLAETDLLFGFSYRESSKITHQIHRLHFHAKKIKTRHYQILIKYIPGLNFYEFMKTQELSPDSFLIIFYHLTLSLASFHHLGHVHRDVKPYNFILTDDKIQLIDYGLSIKKDYAHEIFNEGSMLFAAPESLDDREINNEQSDIYSLGICFLFLLKAVRFNQFARCPLDFEDLIPEQIKAFHFNKNECEELLSIFKGMLSDEPQERLSLNEVGCRIRDLMIHSPRLARISMKERAAYELNPEGKVHLRFKPMILSALRLHGYKDEPPVPSVLKQLVKTNPKTLRQQDSSDLLPGLMQLKDFLSTEPRPVSNGAFVKECHQFLSHLNKSRDEGSRLYGLIRQLNSSIKDIPRPIGTTFFRHLAVINHVKLRLKQLEDTSEKSEQATSPQRTAH